MKAKIISVYGLDKYSCEDEGDTLQQQQTAAAAAEGSSDVIVADAPNYSLDIEAKKFRIAFCNLNFTIKDGRPIQVPSFDFLYIGSIGSAYHRDNLLAAGITHILCLSDVISLKFPEHFTYCRVPIIDKPDYNILTDIDRCIEFIEIAKHYEGNEDGNDKECTDDSIIGSHGDGDGEGGTCTSITSRTTRGKVLVHCYQGKSRCAAVCCAYIMRCTGCSFDESLDIVRQVRPHAAPNSGFVASLRSLHQQSF